MVVLQKAQMKAFDRLYKQAAKNKNTIDMLQKIYTIKLNGEKIKKEVELKNHEKAFEILMQELLEYKIVESLDEIKAIGHRVVNLGEKYNKSIIAKSLTHLQLSLNCSIASSEIVSFTCC